MWLQIKHDTYANLAHARFIRFLSARPPIPGTISHAIIEFDNEEITVDTEFVDQIALAIGAADDLIDDDPADDAEFDTE